MRSRQNVKVYVRGAPALSPQDCATTSTACTARFSLRVDGNCSWLIGCVKTKSHSSAKTPRFSHP